MEKVYAELTCEELKTIEDVPERIREEVTSMLDGED